MVWSCSFLVIQILTFWIKKTRKWITKNEQITLAILDKKNEQMDKKKRVMDKKNEQMDNKK